MLASYLAALKIAKTGRPFTDGDFVKEIMLDVAEVVCPSVSSVLESVPLSANTIHRRVNEMGTDLKEQLKDLISCSVNCSIALDESTDISDTAQLAVFIRLVDSDFNGTEELLDLIPLKNTSTRDVFNAVDELLESMRVDLHKLCSAATDGAAAMLSEGQGFAGRLQRKIQAAGLPAIRIIHCILHQQQLCAKV